MVKGYRVWINETSVFYVFPRETVFLGDLLPATPLLICLLGVTRLVLYDKQMSMLVPDSRRAVAWNAQGPALPSRPLL